MYEIRSDVPLPEKKHYGRKGRYPFRDMDVGDSFFVIGHKEGRAAAQAASMFGRRNSVKFSARSEETGVRIWRIE